MAISTNCMSISWWNWMPNGFELDVSIICARSKEPLYIKAGPFYLLSLKTLITVRKFSDSFKVYYQFELITRIISQIFELSITYFLIMFQLYT